ncbi:MAG: hypothetical protein DSZ24_06560, partial [Thermodesulfatator sp.]
FIIISNEANHALFLHPMRLAQLHVSVDREGNRVDLEPVSFLRIIGKNGKASMPWVADSVVKDTQIQAGESREVFFPYPLRSDDVIEAKIGFYRVNPKAAENLGLTGDKSLTSFTVLKKALFHIGK